MIYGLNTLGAATGAFVTGFFLVKTLGTVKTIQVAALCNFALAAAFLPDPVKEMLTLKLIEGYERNGVME